MSVLRITLKSGAVVEADVSEWTWGRGTLAWKTPAGGIRQLVYVDLNEVVAIVEMRPEIDRLPEPEAVP